MKMWQIFSTYHETAAGVEERINAEWQILAKCHVTPSEEGCQARRHIELYR